MLHYLVIACEKNSQDKPIKILHMRNDDRNPVKMVNGKRQELKVLYISEMENAEDYRNRLHGYAFKYHIGDGWFDMSLNQLFEYFKINNAFYEEFSKKF